MCATGLNKSLENDQRLNSQQVFNSCYELDELYRFVERKANTETWENVYLMTMVSRLPRRIVGFDVAYDKSPERIQAMVDRVSWAKAYYSDGWSGYKDVIYPGKYMQNFHNKNDTFTVEGMNADLRCYIPILVRRSRCFARTIETLYAVVAVFVDAYNAFGTAKMRWRASHDKGDLPNFPLAWFLSYNMRFCPLPIFFIPLTFDSWSFLTADDVEDSILPANYIIEFARLKSIKTQRKLLVEMII